MISLHDQPCIMGERDDDDQSQMCPLPRHIVFMDLRWSVAYLFSYRKVEELLGEHRVPIDHATIQRWVVKYSPLLEETFHRHKHPVWISWPMDETYIKIKGQ